MAILTSDKEDFKTNSISSDKEGCFMIIEGSIYQETITILSGHAPSNRASKKQAKTHRTKRKKKHSTLLMIEQTGKKSSYVQKI